MADPDLQIRKGRGGGGGGGGGGHQAPEIKGGRAWSPFWSKNKGGRVPRAPPLDPPLVLSFFLVFYPVLCSQNFLS